MKTQSSQPKKIGAREGGKPDEAGRNAASRMPPRRTWLTFLIVLLANYLLMRLLFPSLELLERSLATDLGERGRFSRNAEPVKGLKQLVVVIDDGYTSGTDSLGGRLKQGIGR